MKMLTTWMLAGALAASLTWNWKLYRHAEANTLCGSAASCELAGAELGLDEAQRAALAEMCTSSCGVSDELERQADERQQELLASLARPDVDPEAAAKLVDEIGELRRRSLATCVEGILGVREVLSGEQVRALLERCEHTSCK